MCSLTRALNLQTADIFFALKLKFHQGKILKHLNYTKAPGTMGWSGIQSKWMPSFLMWCIVNANHIAPYYHGLFSIFDAISIWTEIFLLFLLCILHLKLLNGLTLMGLLVEACELLLRADEIQYLQVAHISGKKKLKEPEHMPNPITFVTEATKSLLLNWFVASVCVCIQMCLCP